MIAALYGSRPEGAKDFTRNDHQFGWKTIEKVFAEDLERAENGLSRKVPGLKYAHVYRDNWTRLNVRPAKIIQVWRVSSVKRDKTGKMISLIGILYICSILSVLKVDQRCSILNPIHSILPTPQSSHLM